MHNFLKSIGFRNIDRKKWKQYLLYFEKSARKVASFEGSGGELREYRILEVAPSMGIAMCGEVDEDGVFQLEYYFPYLESDLVSTTSFCEWKRMGDREAYVGSTEDYRIGISLIFYINHFYKLLRQKELEQNGLVCHVCFSGLAESGKILLPIEKSREEVVAAKKASQKRGELIEAAKNGDSEAVEELTKEEMNMFHSLNRRIAKSDLYSVIDNFFMPYGVECDQYSILGEILKLDTVVNEITDEKIYLMTLECNDMMMRVIINQEDLLGEPEVGRRFKGNIWMQAALFPKAGEKTVDCFLDE